MRQLCLIAALSAFALPVMADDAAVLLGVDRYNDFPRVRGGTQIVGTADAMRAAGYSVGALANGSVRDSKQLLSDLGLKSVTADRLVVGLSGRFVTDGTRNWFMAENTNVPAPFAMGDAISLEMLMQVMAQTPGQSVLLLGFDEGGDAEFGAYFREGLSTLDVPQGVTVITGEPRQIDAVVTRAVTVEGGNVMDFVRNDARFDVMGYQPKMLVLQPADDSEPAAPVPQIDPSLRPWNDAQQANTADSYRDFLFDYPRSRYASEARRRLDAIENDPIRQAELAEDGLNLSRNERRAIQRNLTLLGFNTRGVDGIFGPGSRGAVRNWQQDNGFAQTSFLTASQINRIDAQASRRAAEIEAEEEQARAEALQLDRDYWDETGARGNPAGYRAYLERYPEGVFAEEARAKLDALTNNTAEAEAREQALNLNPVLRRLIESRLRSLGYDVGNVDGRFDRTTRRAIARYQSASGVTSTGYVDQATLARLLSDTFGR